MADRIRVALLDNHPLFRRGIHDALGGTKLAIVAEGDATEEACQAALKKKPEIVLMDIDGEGEGIRLAERILANLISAKVVILTGSSDEEDIAEALRIGVHGYILKGVGAVELVTALEGIFEGQPYITPALATRLLLRDKGQSLRPSKDKELVFTARDRQVLGPPRRRPHQRGDRRPLGPQHPHHQTLLDRRLPQNAGAQSRRGRGARQSHGHL